MSDTASPSGRALDGVDPFGRQELATTLERDYELAATINRERRGDQRAGYVVNTAAERDRCCHQSLRALAVAIDTFGRRASTGEHLRARTAP